MPQSSRARARRRAPAGPGVPRGHRLPRAGRAKAGWLLLAALAWGGAVGALVTWWSGPQNAVAASQFTPATFDVQGIMPAAYSLFAMALGIAAGTLIRRVLPALVVTLGVFFAVRLIIEDWVRQHYMTPVIGIYNVALGNIPRPKGAAWVLGHQPPRRLARSWR